MKYDFTCRCLLDPMDVNDFIRGLVRYAPCVKHNEAGMYECEDGDFVSRDALIEAMSFLAGSNVQAQRMAPDHELK